MSELIKLCVEIRQTQAELSTDTNAWMEGADALVIDPCRCTPGQFESMPVESSILIHADPIRDAPWLKIADYWVCDEGLEATARLRDLHPALCWIPRLNVSRARVNYRFSAPAIGEGFSFYIPDTSAINAWRVVDSDLSLRASLARAAELDFKELWLHSPDAASRKRGLELDLLDKTKDDSWAIWLSGGVGGSEHLRNLQRVGGGVARVVVEEATALQASVPALRNALIPEGMSPQAMPMTLNPTVSELAPH